MVDLLEVRSYLSAGTRSEQLTHVDMKASKVKTDASDRNAGSSTAKGSRRSSHIFGLTSDIPYREHFKDIPC